MCLLGQEINNKSALKNINSSVVRKRVQSYSILRDEGLIPKDIIFIQKAMENLPPIEKKKAVLPVANMVSWSLSKRESLTLPRLGSTSLNLRAFSHPMIPKGSSKDWSRISKRFERFGR